jgi:hypothetical protein
MSNLLHEFNSTSFESSLQIPYDSPSKTSMGISFSKFLFESTFILFCFSLISFEYLLTIYGSSLPKYLSQKMENHFLYSWAKTLYFPPLPFLHQPAQISLPPSPFSARPVRHPAFSRGPATAYGPAHHYTA